MRKRSKAAKIVKELETGKTPKEVASALKVPISSVYTVNWKRKRDLALAKGLSRLNKLRMAVDPPLDSKPPVVDPALDFLREELASVERQIDNLNTVASFLTIRLRQLEQNGG